MEDIEVNTNFQKPNEVDKPKESNVLFKPTYSKEQLVDDSVRLPNQTVTPSMLNRSSMMTYGKM
jgi:hypothetical protein